MAMIDFTQIKNGKQLINNVSNSFDKSAVINEWSETPSDDLVPSEAMLENKVLTTIANKAVHVEETLVITAPTTTIALSNTPTESKVVLVVNGVDYREGYALTVDRTTKTVTWTGEFPLTPDTVDKATVLYMTIKQNDNGGTSFPKAKHIVGMVLAQQGSGYQTVKMRSVNKTVYTEEKPTAKGDWRRIDQNYNEVDFDPEHGTWAGMKEVTTSLDDMLGKFVEIPITWVKNEVIQSGPYAGCNCWWMADGEAPGFHIHPAFIKPDGTPGKLRVGKYLVSFPKNYDGDYGEFFYDFLEADMQVDDVYYTLKMSSYSDLRNKALTYNTADETGYRAYSIYDHHFLARMILTEFCNPNIFFFRYYDNDTHTYTDEWHEGICEHGGYVLPDQQPSNAQTNIPFDYHGIKCILGDNYANCWLDGLTTLNGTYQLMAADGSGTMVETDIECPAYGTWVANCLMNKVNGVDFGDVFINDGTNVDDNISSMMEGRSYGDDGGPGSEHIAQGSFCDYQYIVRDRAVYTQYEEEYNYTGLFMLNSESVDAHKCWRLVQVV